MLFNLDCKLNDIAVRPADLKTKVDKNGPVSLTKLK